MELWGPPLNGVRGGGRSMLAGLFLGTLVVLGATAFPLAWLGLELNLMAFLP